MKMRKYVGMFTEKVLSLSLPTYGKCSTSLFSKLTIWVQVQVTKPQQSRAEHSVQHTFLTSKSYIFFILCRFIQLTFLSEKKNCLVWGNCMNFLEEKERNCVMLCILYT